MAKRLGYELAKIVVFGAQTEQPVQQLLNAIERVTADAVVMPNLAHLGDELDRVVRVCDVITVNPENTYARWVLPVDRWPAPGTAERARPLDETGGDQHPDGLERLD
ncbi:hypothetical protein ACFYO1_07145 [Nocardia sp. NPDC006044]|uniref:hypothetical protein n=1 Tax=Nocardia sp. NPDC006044 TaxID=3364306 RepID=UPI003698F98C